jgi:hypothetical protein
MTCGPFKEKITVFLNVLHLSPACRIDFKGCATPVNRGDCSFHPKESWQERCSALDQGAT